MNLSRKIVMLLACGVSACVTQTTVPPRADGGGQGQPARNVTEFRSKPRRAAGGLERADERLSREPRASASDDGDALPPRGDTVAGGSEFAADRPSRAEPFPIPGIGGDETNNVFPADPRGGASRLPDEGGLQRGVPRRPSVRDRDYAEPADVGAVRRGFGSERPLARDDVFAGGETSAEDLNRAYSRGGYGRDPRWAGAVNRDESVRGLPRPRPSFAANAGDDLPPARTPLRPDGSEFNAQLEQELFGDKESAEHARARAMALAANDPRARAADLPPPEAYAERDSVMPHPWRGGARSYVTDSFDKESEQERIRQRDERTRQARAAYLEREREKEQARARLEAREREEQQAEARQLESRRLAAKRAQEQRDREEQQERAERQAEARRVAERQAQQERQEAQQRQETERRQQAKRDALRQQQEEEDRERAEEARREQQEAVARRASARAERPAPAPFKRAAESALDQGWHKGEPGRPVPYVDTAKPKATAAKPASSENAGVKALAKSVLPGKKPTEKPTEPEEAVVKPVKEALKEAKPKPAETVKTVTPVAGVAKPPLDKTERTMKSEVKPAAKPSEKAEAKPKLTSAPVVSEGKPAAVSAPAAPKAGALPKPAVAHKPSSKDGSDGDASKEKKPKASEAAKAKEDAFATEKKAK